VALVKPTSKRGEITGDDLEEAYVYQGVYPTIISEESVTASDQSANEATVANVTFRFDGAPFDLGTIGMRSAVAEALSDYNYNDTYTMVGNGI
jgi:hypothetical protein